jgi:peptide/nickel transport system substrate-binding protein
MDSSSSVSHFFRGRRDDGALDKEVIAALTTADTSVDLEVRKEHYQKALKKIAEQAYWVPLYTYVMNYAFNKDLDFTPYGDAIARFYQCKWK